MKFTTKQLKDLILLSKGTCIIRDCADCMWWNDILTSPCPWIVDKDNDLLSEVQKNVKEVIRKIIG